MSNAINKTSQILPASLYCISWRGPRVRTCPYSSEGNSCGGIGAVCCCCTNRLSCGVGVKFSIGPEAAPATALRFRRRKNQNAKSAPATSGIPTPNPTPRPTPRLLLPPLEAPSDGEGVGVGVEVGLGVGDEVGRLPGPTVWVLARTTASMEKVWVELLQSQPLNPVQQNFSLPQVVTPFPASGRCQ